MPATHRLLVLLAALLLPASASAVPMVSMDTDPDASGVQASSTVLLGSTFEVDAVVDVDADELSGFQIMIGYDPAVLGALDVVDGGFLLEPVFEVVKDVGALRVSFAEVTIGSTGATGSGVLATLSFEALGLGTSPLDIIESGDPTETVILSAPFGVPLCGVPGQVACDVGDGSITVVPEPRAAMLLMLGVVSLALRQPGRRARPLLSR
ncbi:MAG: cohesin domain-containing protein [Myxococcota bacterium]|nr:cohesin domain-containing protein [Myxococcota bacterium]